MFAGRYPDQTRFAFRPGITCLTTGAGAILLNPPHSEKLARLSTEQSAALKRLNVGPATVSDLAGAGPGAAQARGIEALIDHLATRGYLTVTSCGDATDLYSIIPFGRPPPRPDPTPGASMSKFAVLHSDSAGFVLEHPLGWCDVRIHTPRLLPLLGGQVSDCPDLPTTVVSQFLDDLSWAGALVRPDDEKSSFEALSWSTPDLWFHRRSTLGQRVVTWDDFGPTKWAKGRFAQPPGCRTAYPGDPVALPVPDLSVRRSQDPPLAAVIEDRVSTRAFDDERPITAEQLGELLYRTARTRGTQAAAAGEELLSRPYPSGGGIYELEIYPVVRSVAGLESGMYHYDSFEHALCPVAAADAPATTQLIKPAAATLAGGAEPQVVLVIAARAGRMMWTYEQIAYATVLKNVGALMQTVYLAATAMGLGVCAQGFSDTAAFVAATGVDERQECSVGSIIVGSRTP